MTDSMMIDPRTLTPTVDMPDWPPLTVSGSRDVGGRAVWAVPQVRHWLCAVASNSAWLAHPHLRSLKAAGEQKAFALGPSPFRGSLG
jgi:hypothetical protein